VVEILHQKSNLLQESSLDLNRRARKCLGGDGVLTNSHRSAGRFGLALIFRASDLKAAANSAAVLKTGETRPFFDFRFSPVQTRINEPPLRWRIVIAGIRALGVVCGSFWSQDDLAAFKRGFNHIALRDAGDIL